MNAWTRRLGSLPRETRDTLFLLGVIAWTVMPHFGQLPLWCTIMSVAILGWRARLAWTSAPLPTRWVLIGVLLVALALTGWSHRTLLGKEAGVTLVVVLMSLKTLELRARRDAFVVFFLGFFLVLTHFLFSQSLFVAAAMLVSVWGLLTALVLAHMPVGQPSLRQAATLAGRTALLGAPVMVMLFLLFPRIGPLWSVPQDGRSGTGLSDTMEIGSIAEVALDDRIAMRVRFPQGAPPAASLYFRGPVLSAFDGRQWRRGGSEFAPAQRLAAELRTAGPALTYEVTLEPSRLTSLPVLDGTVSVEPFGDHEVRMGPELEWTARRPLFERVRFVADAHLEFRHGPAGKVLGLQDHLGLPPGFNPRTLEWAASLRRTPGLAEADPQTLVAAVMRHIRDGGYTYTLAPGPYGDQAGRHAIDEFWLDRREGFCEHFAAAFVVIMRALDVPARVVTGFQGTDPQPVDGYHVVRNSAAHAWAEYWQPGIGWVRADPTAVIAPDRIQASRSLRPAPGLVTGAFNAVNPALLAQLRAVWEAVDNRWNQWVLNYSRQQQFDLLRQLGWRAPTFEDVGMALGVAIGLLALAGAAWAWWDRRREEPWQRLLAGMRQALRRVGVEAAAHESPAQLGRRVRQHLGPDGEALAGLLDELERRRYGPGAVTQPPREWLRRLDAAARSLGTRRAPTTTSPA